MLCGTSDAFTPLIIRLTQFCSLWVFGGSWRCPQVKRKRSIGGCFLSIFVRGVFARGRESFCFLCATRLCGDGIHTFWSRGSGIKRFVRDALLVQARDFYLGRDHGIFPNPAHNRVGKSRGKNPEGYSAWYAVCCVLCYFPWNIPYMAYFMLPCRTPWISKWGSFGMHHEVSHGTPHGVADGVVCT